MKNENERDFRFQLANLYNTINDPRLYDKKLRPHDKIKAAEVNVSFYIQAMISTIDSHLSAEMEYRQVEI